MNLQSGWTARMLALRMFDVQGIEFMALRHRAFEFLRVPGKAAVPRRRRAALSTARGRSAGPAGGDPRTGRVAHSRLTSRNLGEPVNNRRFTLLLGSTSCGNRPERRARSQRARLGRAFSFPDGRIGQPRNPRFLAAKLPRLGATTPSSSSPTPNQLASVAAYWSTEVVGTIRPSLTSSGPPISSRGILP